MVNNMNVSSDFEHEVLEVIQQRKSLRAYADRPIETEKINSLFEAARWAPSSVNEQPWRYIYATNDQPDLWSRIFDSLNESNKVWVQHAPLLIASFTRKTFTRNDQSNHYSLYDLGAANALLALQSTALGLQLHQLGGYNSIILRDNLSIPDSFQLGAVLAIGYPGDPELLPENLKSRELAPRLRNKHEKFVFNSVFSSYE
jgi:nitroreductase